MPTTKRRPRLPPKTPTPRADLSVTTVEAGKQRKDVVKRLRAKDCHGEIQLPVQRGTVKTVRGK